jgi:hypothetical protein
LSAARILVGLLTLGAILAPAAVAGWRWQGRLSARSYPTRVLAAIVIGVSLVIVSSQLVGSFGLFKPVALITASWVVSGAALLLAGRLPASGAPQPVTHEQRTPANHGILLWAAMASAVAVSVQWLSLTWVALANGVRDPDSYHLAFAAQFVRTGSLTQLHPVFADPVHSFHPVSTELLQALGMISMGRDVLVPLFSVFWLGLLLLSGWCAGERHGIAPLTLMATSWVAGIPLLATTNAGTAVNDIAVLACLAAAVALWQTSDGQRRWLALTGLALGLGVGAKLLTLAPGGALLMVMVVLARRGRRVATAATLAVGVVLTGGYWYLRNLLRAGSPVPSLHLPGLPRPPLPIVDRFGYTVAQELFDRTAWRSAFSPGLRLFFGWSAVLAAIGLLAAVWRLIKAGNTTALALIGCGVVAVIAYLFTPLTAWGVDRHHPDALLFVLDLRYTLPGLLLVGLGLAIGFEGTSRRLQQWAAGWVLLAVAFEVFRKPPFVPVPAKYVVEAILVVGLAAGVGWALHLATVAAPWKVTGTVAAVLLVCVGLGPSISRTELAGATVGDSSATTTMFKWAQSQHGARIGYYALNRYYPLYGPSWSNDVAYIGVNGPHGAFRAPATCEEYLQVLAKHRFDYVIFGPAGPYLPDPPLARWTRAQADARLVLSAGPYQVFKVAPPYSVSKCEAAA